MDEVADYITSYENEQAREVMKFLDHMIMGFPNMVSKLRYKVPFYYRKSWICYLSPQKNGAVELAFTRGNELSNEQGLLDFKGRKQVSSISLTSVADIPTTAIHEILNEAILLDNTVPYASKRTASKKG